MSAAFQLLATENPEVIMDTVNGVGSTVGWLGRLTFHLIPNTIWFLDITPASDIHDIDYAYPSSFKSEGAAIRHKDQADRRFYDNVKILIEAHTSNRVLKCLRYRRLRKYYWTLKNFGMESFLESKEMVP